MPYGPMIPDKPSPVQSIFSDPQALMAALQQMAFPPVQQQPSGVQSLFEGLGIGGGQGLLERLQELQKSQNYNELNPLGNLINPDAAENLFQQGLEGGTPQFIQKMEPQTVLEPIKGPSKLEQLLGMLTEAGTSVGSPIDIDAAIQDSNDAINQAFGAQIGAIKGQNKGARADTKEGASEIQRMYKSLARAMKRTGKQERRQGRNLAQELQALGGAGAQQTTGNAADLLNANAAAGQGIPGLTAELNSDVNNEAQLQADRMLSEGTRNAAMARGMSGVASRYLNRSAMTSRLEGTNRASDLFADLQDYLQGNRDKIADLKGQKAQALASASADIMGSLSQAQSDQQQQIFDNLMNIANFNLDWKKARQDAQGGGEGGPTVADELQKAMGGFGAANNLFSLAGQAGVVSPDQQQELVNALEALRNDPNSLQGESGMFSIGKGQELEGRNPNVAYALAQQAMPEGNPMMWQLLAQAFLQNSGG